MLGDMYQKPDDGFLLSSNNKVTYLTPEHTAIPLFDFSVLQQQLKQVYQVLFEVERHLDGFGKDNSSARSKCSLQSSRAKRLSNFGAKESDDLICYEKIDLSKIKKLQFKVQDTLSKLSMSSRSLS